MKSLRKEICSFVMISKPLQSAKYNNSDVYFYFTRRVPNFTLIKWHTWEWLFLVFGGFGPENILEVKEWTEE
jgi:hypothetical protein